MNAMQLIMQPVRRMFGRAGLWGAAAAMAATSGFSSSASAGGFSFGLSVHRARVWVEPVYEQRAREFVIPALHEDVVRKVWREPVYETRRILIEVPPVIVSERVPQFDRRGRLVGYRTVERVVKAGGKAWKTERVLVRAGQYETVVERVCVRPERRETVYENALVRPGYWSADPCPITQPVDRANDRFLVIHRDHDRNWGRDRDGGRDGYRQRNDNEDRWDGRDFRVQASWGD